MAFPTSLTNAQDGVTTVSAADLNNLEAKVGIDGSAVTTSHDYKLSGVTGTDKAASKTGTETLTNKTLTSPALTTPKITTSINDANGNEVIKTPATSSAVNEITVTNAATGNNPEISATGGDTNISLKLSAKGTGKILTTGHYTVVTAASPSASATQDLNLALGNIFNITMPAGNITFTVSNEVVGQCFLVSILQDATGSRTVTWFDTIRWAGGSAPTLTTTASKRDTFGFIVTGTDTYDGFIVGQGA